MFLDKLGVSLPHLCEYMLSNFWVVTENWSLPKNPGRIDPNNFSPYPKNPLLANFFINIGRADVLGSGVRNLYLFTKLYSGGEPELIDGDVFKTIIPLSLSVNKMSDNKVMNDNLGDNEVCKSILTYITHNGSISTAQAAQVIGRSHSTARRVLVQLVSEDVLVPSGANRNRIYCMKDKMTFLKR